MPNTLKPLTTFVFERYEAQGGQSVGVAIAAKFSGEMVPLWFGEVCAPISNCVAHLAAFLSVP